MSRATSIVFALVLVLGIAAAAPARAEVRRRSKVRLIHEGPRVSWVARSQIEADHQRSRRSGFSGKHREDALKVKIEIDRVRGFEDPRTKATCTLDLAKGDEVVVIGRGHEGWILVENAAGDTGWIPASVVGDAGRFAGDPRREPAAARVAAAADPAEAGDAPAPGAQGLRRVASPPPRVVVGLLASAGAETFALRQPDAMAIASGPAGAVAAAARIRAAGPLWIGVAGSAGMTRGELTYYDTTAQSQPMATHDLVVDASAEVGWGRAWSISARGGYHYAALAVESDRPEPMLAGEKIRGATVGLGATAPLGRRFALAAAVDVMLAGDNAPADAAVPAATSVRGAWARGTLTARLSAHLLAALAYRGGAVDASLPDGTTRSDRTHAVTAGLGVTW